MKIIIAAGGTGGHIFPALALAVELGKHGHSCIWVGRPHSMEESVALTHSMDFYAIHMSGFRGKRLNEMFVAIWQTLLASCKLTLWMRRLARHKHILVVSFGGYTSVAAGVAARLNRLPLVIHEQNSFAGSANKLLAHWASVVCCGFDEVFSQHPRRQYVGNPIRLQPKPNYPVDDGRPLRVLVLGGSLGAASLNRAVTSLLQNHQLTTPLHLVHQCGASTFVETKTMYSSIQQHQPQLRFRLQAFLSRVHWYYPWSDLIICRAGAITLAEVCAAGKAAILIPFPYATDDHQFHNASALVQSGGAELIRDTLDLPMLLAQAVLPLLNQPAKQTRCRLYQKGKKLTVLATPQAASNMVYLIERLGQQ